MHVRITIDEGLATIVLANPPQNRIDTVMVEELAAALDIVERNGTRALLIHAEGPDFSFGGDIVPWPAMSKQALRATFEAYLATFNRFERLAIPTVAAVQGLCFGGGFELAARADVVFASETARFGHPEQSIGIVTLLGGVYRVAERAGRSRAIEWALTSEQVPATVMRDHGVINRVVPDPDLLDTATAFARRLANGPTRAHAAHKALLRVWATGGTAAADEALFDIAMPLFESQDVAMALEPSVAAFRANEPRPHLRLQGSMIMSDHPRTTGQSFEALVLRRAGREISASVETLTEADLPAGDVLIRVHFSDMGYKDGMAITGAGPRQLVQSFPFVPGVDFAGVVERSASAAFKPGDQVIVTGWGVGERHWGGYAQKARVSAEWPVPVPPGMTMRQAMTHGSAGLSAMLCIDALEKHGIAPGSEVLVTGATGGVGSVAVMLLHKLGYRVVGSTSRMAEEAYLRALGASGVVPAAEIGAAPAQPLLPERWTAAIDTVGGATLANILAATAYGGAVAALGLVGGRDLHTTVLPFIKRAVALLGVDSENCPNGIRAAAWQRLAEVLPDGLPEAVVEEVTLEALPARATAIVTGGVRGRTLVVL